MKKSTLWNCSWVVLVLALAGCGGGGGGSAAVTPAVQLAAVALSGAQEVPPVVSTGTGSATVTVSGDRSQVGFNVTFSGLLSGATLAHIHIGHPGEGGPVILNFALAPFTSPLAGTATAADFVAQPARGISTFADAVNAILAGNTYINVHTAVNPTGEIRGALGPARLDATLTGAQEVPPVVTAGSGTATLRLDNLQTSLTFNIAFTLPPNTTTLSHVHMGALGASGPVIVNLALVPFTSPLTGTVTAADLASPPPTGIATLADAINAMLSGNAYVNIHTLGVPTGEIRGQLAGATAP